MEKPKPKESMRKIPCEVTTVRLVTFSFVPPLKKLPTESTVNQGGQERQPMRRSNEYVGKEAAAAAGQTMSGDGVFKADFVYVGGDVDGGDPEDRRARLAKETAVRQEAHSQLNLSAEHMTQGQLTPSQITAPLDSTACISFNMSPVIKNSVMEMANDKHRSKDARDSDASFGSKLSTGLLLNQVPEKWTTLISDCRRTQSTEQLETPASSRESVLSEDWFGPRALSSEGSPASLSCTLSPCSSVRSGLFPSVIQVKRHSLAPASCLVLNPQLSQASSPAPSPCPPSPGMGSAWHRPPPTQLTLLTAILRKGRLPVLSSAQKRAYIPCWPIGVVSLSSCSACNAAAKLALICPAANRSGKAQTTIAAPQREALHMLTHDPESQCLRCLTPPPSPDLLMSNAIDPPVRSLRQSPEYTLRPGSADFTWYRVPSQNQQRGVTSPVQDGITSLTQQCRVTSPNQQCGVTSLAQQCGVTSPTQPHGVSSLTQHRTVTSLSQQSDAALPISPSAPVTRAAHAVQNPQGTLPPMSNPVLSSSFLRLRSQALKNGSPSPCATGDCPAPSYVPGLSCSPEPKLTWTPEPKLSCTPEPKLTCTPEPKLTWTPEPKLSFTPEPKLSFTPEPKLTCTTEHKLIWNPAPKLTCSPEPKLTCSPEPKLTCSPEPKLTCTPEPKLTCSPEPKLTCTPEPKLACSPEPKLTCTPEPKLTCSPEPKLTCTPEPKLTCSPEPKLTCTPEPKLTCSPEPKLTCSPEPKLNCTPEPKPSCTQAPKLTCTPQAKLTCTAVPKLLFTQEPKLTSSPTPKVSFTPEPKNFSSPVPKLTYTQEPRCDDIQSSPAPSPVPKLTSVASPSCSEAKCLSPLQTSIRTSPLSEKLCSQHPANRLSPSPWTPTLSPSPSASLCTLGLLSPLPDSYSSTPNRLSLSTSPATSSRDLLTPSPSLSPSTSPVPKSVSDREGRKRKYKMKPSYKALAAIPTNTLLLDQQAIDDDVEKEGCPLETDADKVSETHSEMCSPAQLRQQSEELYAAIDQVLLDPLPMCRSQSAPLSTVTEADAQVPRRLTPIPRSVGRETKYATFHLQPSGSTERKLTKPGVIRPVAVIPKLSEEGEDFPNPFRRQYLEEMPEEQSHKFVRTPAGQTSELVEDRKVPGSPTFRKGDVRRTDEMDLLITEKGESGRPSVAEGSLKSEPVSFNTARVKTKIHETHI